MTKDRLVSYFEEDTAELFTGHGRKRKVCDKTQRLVSQFEEEMAGLFKGHGIKRKVLELSIFISSNGGEIWLRGSRAWNILS